MSKVSASLRPVVALAFVLIGSRAVAQSSIPLRYTTGYPNTPTPWIDNVTTQPAPTFSTSQAFTSWGTTAVRFSTAEDVTLTGFAGVFVPIPVAGCPDFGCYAGTWFVTIWGPSSEHATALAAYQSSPVQGNIVERTNLMETGLTPYGGGLNNFGDIQTYYQELFLPSSNYLHLLPGQDYLVGILNVGVVGGANFGSIHLAGTTFPGSPSPDWHLYFNSPGGVPRSDRGTAALDIYGFVTDPQPGDYDRDNDVDGADFLLWQRELGSNANPSGSGADGSGNGLVDADDLGVWRDHFGEGSTMVAPIPEPKSLLLGLFAAAVAVRFRRRCGPTVAAIAFVAAVMPHASPATAQQSIPLRYATGYPNTPTPWIDDAMVPPLPTFSNASFQSWGTSAVKFSNADAVTLTDFAGVFVPLPTTDCPNGPNCCGCEGHFQCYDGGWKVSVWAADAQYATALDAYKASPIVGNIKGLLPLVESGLQAYGGGLSEFEDLPTYFQTLSLNASDYISLEENKEYLVGVYVVVPGGPASGGMNFASSDFNATLPPDYYVYVSTPGGVPESNRGTAALDIYGFITGLQLGDYDRDEDVDGADFLLWQRELGSNANPFGTGADGSGNGLVDADDLTVWRDHFGEGPPMANAVPEPTGLGLVLFAVVVAVRVRVRLLQAAVPCVLTATLVFHASTATAQSSTLLRYATGYPNTPTPWIDEVATQPLHSFSTELESKYGTSAVRFTSSSSAVVTGLAGVFVPLPNNSCPDGANCCGCAGHFDCYTERWKANVWTQSAEFPTALAAFIASPLHGNFVDMAPLAESGFEAYAGGFSQGAYPTFYQSFTLNAADVVSIMPNVEYLFSVVALELGGPTFAEVYLSGSTYDVAQPADYYTVNTTPGAAFSNRGTAALDIFGFVTDTLPGDYDRDEDVDGADFLLWQRELGSNANPWGSGADGSGNGLVDADDLTVWRDHFGESALVGQTSTPIPEPPSVALACLFAGAFLKAKSSRPIYRRSRSPK